MAPKEPTRYQVSSRLAYSQSTPAFIQRLKNNVAGVSNEDEHDAFDDWQAASGRPPIPRRPSPPQRPDDDLGSADEDDGDEKPQVVVLKEGKHMTAREVENEKRRARNLPPLPDESHETEDNTREDGKKDTKEKMKAGDSDSVKSTGKKRKAVGDDLDEVVNKEKPEKKSKKTTKAKKANNGALLSFGDNLDG
ncbi:hypothetical protein EW145_g919 [Phellinidium pouzarii]|uniref:DUF4604 domain-containing protein n=1 Tax=Phellinidium pouzarii TaxID=167371 RepID=A0A4S4LI83_9AGAM|nr:hypothetical protein EW145_g919 [Phellinidium pouzarii]